MKKNWLLRQVVKSIWWFAFRVYGRCIPFRFIRYLAFPLFWFFRLIRLRTSVALTNLSLAFPELSESTRHHIAYDSLWNLVVVYLEVPRLGYMSEKELQRYFHISNLDLLTDSQIDTRGALLLSGHIGNWELLAIGAARIADRQFSIIVKDQDDFGELDRTRSKFGNLMIPLHRAALSASRTLSQGGVIAMLADQSAPSTELPVTLFGVETTGFSTPARLALRYRPKVIVGFAIRTSNGRYHVNLLELQHNDLEDTPEGIALFTKRYFDLLEQTIREYPSQWVWQHRRWKRSLGVTYD